MAISLAVHATTITWTNVLGGTWNTAANWSPNSVPGASDTALITTVGNYTVTLDVSPTVAGLTVGGASGAQTLLMNGQMLSLNGLLTINANGSYTVDSGILMGNTNAVLHGTIGWTAGTLTGTLSLAGGSTLNVIGGINHNMPNCVFTNNGTVAWSNGRIRGGSIGTAIYNNGLWDSQGDLTLNNDYGGNGTVFNNAGTFRKSASTGAGTVITGGVLFNNTGRLDVQTNAVYLQSGGNFAGGTATNLLGAVVLNGGAFNINGTATSTNVQLNGGRLTGINVLTNGFNWVSGPWNGAASVTIAAGTILDVTGPADHDMANTLVTNNGVVAWSNGRIRGGSLGTIIYNNGLWDSQGDLTLNSDYGGLGVTFYNIGTLRKSATAGGNTTFTGGVVVNNTGNIDSQTNYIVLSGGGNLTGGTATNLTGFVYLNGGSFNINGTVMSTNVQLAGAILAGNNIIRGGFNWIVGDWNNATSVTIATNSVLLVTGAADHNLANIPVTNNGIVTWGGGRIRGGSGGTAIYNYGLWDSQGDLVFNDDYAGNNTVFNNYGTFRKSAGINTSQTLIAGGVLFNQLSGALDVQAGNLVLQGGANFTGGTATNNNGILWLSAGFFNLNGTVTGTNVIENAGNLAGANVINGCLNWQAGSWNSASSVTIANNSTVLLAGGGGNMYLYGCIVTNYGMFVWNSGHLDGGNTPGTVVYNYGLWDCQNDYIFKNEGAGNGTVFNNYGTLRKSGGAGGNAYTFFAGGVLFNQLAGMIDVQNGTNGLQLAFQGGGNFTGGYITTNINGVTVLSVGNFNINGTITGTNTWEASGNLVGNNIIRGGLSWAGGYWSSGSSVTIANNSLVRLVGGGANMYLYGCTVTNYGTFAWNSGHLDGGNTPGTVVYNYGLWDCQNDYIFKDDGAGNGTVFNNYGTLRKSGGAGGNAYTLFAGGVLFNQLAGAIDVQSGAGGLDLVLQGGGNFTGGYITTNADGVTVLSAGNFNINGTVTGTNTLEASGNLVGNNIIQGGLTWASGYWSSGSSVTIANNSTVLLAGGGGNMYLYGCTVTNYGTFVWNSGHLDGGNTPGTVVYNYGLWDCQNDYIFKNDGAGNGTVFNNYGTLRKSGGAGGNAYTFFAGGVLFNQLAGMIDVQNGTNGLQLAFQGGGNFTGGYITTNINGVTVLSVGNFNINGTITGTNTLEASGILVGNNVIQGGLTWASGYWASGSSVTIASNSMVLLAGGGANMYLYGCTVTNYGTFAWNSGHPDGGNTPGTVVYNYGLWDCQNDYIFKDDGAGNGTVFNNYGTLRKSAGSDANQTILAGGVFLNNFGKLDTQAGWLSLLGGFNLGSGTVNLGINGPTNYGKLNLAGGAALSGTVSANLNNGYIPVAGNSFTNIYYGAFTGGFTTTTLPAVAAWTTNYFPTYYVMTVANSRPVLPILPTNTFVVNELSTLIITNTATDMDLPLQTLNYTLLGGVNGMVLNPATGVFTWAPQQTNSPSTNVISVVVIDNGTPPLSATNTFTVIVLEVNQPPVLGVIGTQTLTLLQPFTIANSATEINIHSATAGYVLVSPPAGASINASGVITWTPTPDQALTTNTITTIVTNSNPYDLVNPHLSATNSFLAVVLPNLMRTNVALHKINATNLDLSWPADHTGWRVESQTNTLAKGIGTNWAAVASSATTNHLTIPVARTNGVVVFRMVYP